MGVYIPYTRLPSAYQEVEYIQSSGTQYINTGFIPSNTSKIEISMGGWSQYQQYCDLFGARRTWSTSYSDGRGFHLGFERNNLYYYMFGVQGNFATSYLSFIDGNDHVIQMSSSGIYQDGTLKYTYNNYTFTSPVSWTIFALNDNGTVSSHSAYKLYYAKLWDNGTLVRDLVPCYRKSGSVIGMYDLVNNQFYTNSGTGTFSKGNDVYMSDLKNAYIGQGIWKPGSNTIAYRPFLSDLKDYSGNGHDFSIKDGTVSYSNNMVTISSRLRTANNDVPLYGYSGDFTILGYTQSSGSTNNRFMFLYNPNDNGTSSMFGINTDGCTGNYVYGNNQGWTGVSYYTTPTGIHLLTFVKTSSAQILYLDGTEVARNTTNVFPVGAVRGMISMGLGRHSAGGGTGVRGNLIVENKARTVQEIADYYNITKGNYGL